jgi:DNA-binding CsgD family transcriptional regulator
MLVGRPGLSPQMVGRADELDRLARLVEARQLPAVALVGGEAGVGKTRLVRELVDRLPPGTVVHAGQADPGSLGRPFELLFDALDTGRPSDDERLALLADPQRPADERLRLGLEVVCDLTARTPSVLVFDDLHWADSESVALFERLAEQGSGPVLLIGTYRPDALHRRHPTAEMLPRIERRHAVTHVHLERLSVGEVGSFLESVYGREPSYRVIEALHARTGGNPFFLEELLAAARQDDPDDLMRLELPWSLAELVRAQLDDLSTAQRCVLETAAVLGVTRVSFDVLAAVSGYSEDELIQILRHLVARGLLVESEADAFSFRHALAREAIESDLLGRERRQMHQAALDALRAAGSEDFAAMAHHAHGAGKFDDMVEAAREGARRSVHSGSTYQALQLAELGLSEAGDDPELLDLASRAAWMSGLLTDARSLARRSFERAERAGDLEAESAALRIICRLDHDVSDAMATAKSTAALAELVEQLDEGLEQGRAFAVLAEMYMLVDDIAAVTFWADRAVELADRLGLPEVRAHAQIERGSAFMNVPDKVEDGAVLLAEAIDDAAALGQWVIVARGLNNLVRGDYYRPDADEARTLLVRMRDATERAGFDLFAGSYWDGLADLAEWEGDLGSALTQVEEALRAQRHSAGSKPVFWYRAHAAGLALEAGEVDRALAIFEQVEPAVGAKAMWWRGLGVHIAALRHDAEGVRRHSAALVEISHTRGGVDPQLVHDLVRAMLLGGISHEEVHGMFDLLPIGFGHGTLEDDPYRILARAELLEARGDHEIALRDYEAAIARAGHQVRPAALGTARVGAGRTLVALGRLDAAKEHAAIAAELLARWGGTRVEELAALQRRLGGGETVEGPAELTPREREVVALLAEGLTNGELATRLFISPKTASVHVSNILAKLSMTSRSEIAVYAVRSGLADA